MNTPIRLFICLSVMTLFVCCKKETVHSEPDYNLKANELIQQIIVDYSCVCILEIPNESFIKTSQNEIPGLDIPKLLIEKLHLRDKKELDSLEKLTHKFILDTVFTKQKNIKVIPINSLKELAKGTNLIKTCPGEFLSISKPIFNKEYKIAVVRYGYVFQCIGGGIATYRFKNGKWSRK